MAMKEDAPMWLQTEGGSDQAPPPSAFSLPESTSARAESTSLNPSVLFYSKLFDSLRYLRISQFSKIMSEKVIFNFYYGNTVLLHFSLKKSNGIL